MNGAATKGATLESSPADNLTGTIAGRFAIHARLGAGGMGEVYRAEDLRLRRSVAIKRLAPQLAADPTYHQRFLKEGQRASALNNAHIAGIYDVFECENELYLVMEYIEGATLRERLTQPVGTAEFLQIGIQCAEALEAAHNKGIVHGDVKPENIMLTPSHQVKILDFGVARRLITADHPVSASLPTADINAQSASLLTQQPGISGTPAYMAPEVMLEKLVDGRADIFGLGVVFYEMLAGSNPFRSDTFLGTTGRILHETPPSLAEVNPDVPPEVEQMVIRALAKDPADRYATAQDLENDLRAIERKLEAGELASGRRRRVPRRYLIGVAILAALAVVIAGVRLARHSGLLSRPSQSSQPAAPAQPIAQQLAVLPFDAIGGDARLQAFADGLTDTLSGKLTQLTATRSLGVFPASEVRAHNIHSVEQARKEFGVNLVLTGSLESAGPQVRVTTVLIDGKTRRQVGSQTVTAALADAFAVEDQVVEGSVRMLGIEPQEKERETLTAHGTQQAAAFNDYLEGRGYMQHVAKTENVTSAIQAFDRALEKDRGYGLAYAGLGEAYWARFDASHDSSWVGPARNVCQKSASLGNAGAEAYACLGLVSNGTGQYAAAAEEFKRALELEPTSDEAYTGLAQAYENLGRFADAEKIYQQAIALRPNYAIAYGWLGIFYFNRGRYGEAARLFRTTVDLVPDWFFAYSNLGGAYVMDGRYADAIEPLKRSIEIQPTAAAYSNLGTAYYGLHQFVEAAREYEEAAKLDPREYDLWGNLGDAYSWAPGEQDRAPAAYRRAVELAHQALAVNPKDATVVSYLATYEAMLGDRSAARVALERSLQLAPRDPEMMFNAALVHNQLGDKDQALDWLAKAVAAGYPVANLRNTPNFSNLQGDRRFEKLLQRR